MKIENKMVKRYNQGRLRLEDIGMKLGNSGFKKIAYGFGIVLVMYALLYIPLYALGITNFIGYGFLNQSPLNAIGIHFAWDFLGPLMGVGKSMFNTNFILVFQNTKNGEFLATLVETSVFVLLFFIVLVKYKSDEVKVNGEETKIWE